MASNALRDEDIQFDGGNLDVGIDVAYKVAHEAQVKRPFRAVVKVIWGSKAFERLRRQRSDRPRLAAPQHRPFHPRGGAAGEAASSHPVGGFSTRWADADSGLAIA
jgi:hypothetical protein